MISWWILFSQFSRIKKEKRYIGSFYVIGSTGILEQGVLYRLAAMKRASQANHAGKIAAAPRFAFTFFDFHIWVSHQPAAEKKKKDWNFTTGNVDDIWNVKQSIIPWKKKSILSNIIRNNKKKRLGGNLWEDLPQEWSEVKHTHTPKR